MSNGRLRGRVALVTGSSSGLGRAIALAFAEQDIKFILCVDINGETPAGELTRTVDLIRGQHGSDRASFYKANVTESGAVETAVRAATRLGGGRLDIICEISVVNNAGIGFEDVMMHDMEPSTWDKMMTVNLRSVFLGCKYACTQFLKQDPLPSGERGWIINTSSGAGLRPVAGGATAYCASKAAVVQFTKAVALDYAPHKIHCNAICPGYLKTPMTKQMHENKETAAQMISQTPWGSLTTVEDVAKTVVFLASDDAAGVTGMPLAVDGGFAVH